MKASTPSDAIVATGQNALALGFSGNLGNIDAYISAVNRLPMLTQEEEVSLARRWRESNDLAAAQGLVLSHLRLVVSIARGYLGYGLPHADLIQEGNIGLMKAVKRFDPDQGVRLVSYAMHWIKAEMHEYILKNWRLVKVATTKAQRKLFFNLRSHKEGLDSMTPAQVDALAKTLNVKREEVIEMETRLSGRDIALESPTDDEDDKFSPIAYCRPKVRSRARSWKRSASTGCSPRDWKPRSKSWTRVRVASSKRAGWPMTTARARRCMSWRTSSAYRPSASGRSRRSR